MLKSNDLINKVKSYNKFLNPETLDKAYNFAVKAHENQKRHSGDPYVMVSKFSIRSPLPGFSIISK